MVHTNDHGIITTHAVRTKAIAYVYFEQREDREPHFAVVSLRLGYSPHPQGSRAELRTTNIDDIAMLQRFVTGDARQ